MSVLETAVAARLRTAINAGAGELFGVLNGLCTELPGVRTVTWLATRLEVGRMVRVGSSDPATFPLGGFDPISDNAWCRRILTEKLPIIGNTPQEMSFYIPETAELEAIGFGAIVCAPIVIAGKTRGSVNLLGAAGTFTPAVLAEIDDLLPLAALVFTLDDLPA